MASIRYIIEDVDQAITFYTRHLGFTLEWNASQEASKSGLKIPQATSLKCLSQRDPHLAP